MPLLSLLVSLFVLAIVCFIVYLILKQFVLPNVPAPAGTIIMLVFALVVLIALLNIFGFLPDLNAIRVGR